MGIKDDLKDLEHKLKELQKVSKQLLPILLERIELAELAVLQWNESPFAEGFLESATGYYHELRGLVELLEVYDCGSVGGFGKGQNHRLSSLQSRAHWLMKKYKGKQ